MADARPVCVCCQHAEVGVYDLVCVDCIPTAQAFGLIDAAPVPDTRMSIGPTDV